MRLSNKTNKEELIRFLSDVTQIREPAVIFITRMLRHEMLKAKIEGYRVITTTNKDRKNKGLTILDSKNYKAKEKQKHEKRKIKSGTNRIRLRGTSRETLRQTIQIWSLCCSPHAS